MTNKTANPRVAAIGRDPLARQRLRNSLRSGWAGMLDRISTQARWIISAAIGLIMPAVLIAESAATPIAEAMACLGNGSFMALAATANVFTLIP